MHSVQAVHNVPSTVTLSSFTTSAGQPVNLTHTLFLNVDVGELVQRIVNKEEYGRPFITLSPKSITIPLSKMRLDVKLQFAGRTCTNYIFSFGDFGDN